MFVKTVSLRTLFQFSFLLSVDPPTVQISNSRHSRHGNKSSGNSVGLKNWKGNKCERERGSYFLQSVTKVLLLSCVTLKCFHGARNEREERVVFPVRFAEFLIMISSQWSESKEEGSK